MSARCPLQASSRVVLPRPFKSSHPMISASQPPPKKPSLSRSWPTKRSTNGHRTSPRPPVHAGRRSSVKFLMRRRARFRQCNRDPRRFDRAPSRRNGLLVVSSLLYIIAAFCSSCASNANINPNALTFLLESNPTNLDPRFATDAASQHIDGLLFSSLLSRDAEMNLHGDLARIVGNS